MENIPKKVAILGHRGLPAKYGGFETLAEKITPLLVSQGFEVVNYCRSSNTNPSIKQYLSSQLVVLPTVKTKHLDTIVHTFLSVIHLIFHPVDYVIMLNLGNAPLAWIPRLFKMKVILHVDGFEWQRAKWSKLVKSYFKWCARLAVKTASIIVTDSQAVQNYYQNQLNTQTTYIPYGSDTKEASGDLSKLELTPKKYLLYAARFEPENNPLLVRQAFERLSTDFRLVMVGDAPYAKDYISQVKNTTDHRIIFTGYLHGQDYLNLLNNAYLYIRASEAGGLSPAVLEAMGQGTCVLANDREPNREALGDSGLYYQLDVKSLSAAINQAINHPELVSQLAIKAKERVNQQFNWQAVAQAFINLFNLHV